MKGNEPTYPIVAGKSVGHYGMSIRLKIAAMAMQGMLGNNGLKINNVETGIATNVLEPEAIAEASLKFADTLLKQEEETKP